MRTYEELVEALRAVDGKLDLAIDKERTATETSQISTFQPPKIRSTKDATKTLGNRVFYAYSYLSSPETTDLLKSAKGKGSLKLDQSRLDLFLDKTARYLATELRGKYEIIVMPKSSSTLAKTFGYKMGKYLDLDVIYDSFDKVEIRLPEDRKLALEYIKNNFVDLAAFKRDYKGDEKQRSTALNSLVSGIYRSLVKNGKIELKNLFKPTAKFAANFLRKEIHVGNQLTGKKVLVVDDSFSSGGTMMEIFRQSKASGAESIEGAVIFLQKTK